MKNNFEKSISVIIPVYNGVKWIERCILSVMAQEIKNIEIICIDDGSYEKLQNLKKKYNNLVVIRQKIREYQ